MSSLELYPPELIARASYGRPAKQKMFLKTNACIEPRRMSVAGMTNLRVVEMTKAASPRCGWNDVLIHREAQVTHNGMHAVGSGDRRPAAPLLRPPRVLEAGGLHVRAVRLPPPCDRSQ